MRQGNSKSSGFTVG